MSYKYRQGETPDHVNSEDSNDTIPTVPISAQSDTTDLKNRIKAASDTLDSVAKTPTGGTPSNRKYTVNDLTEIEDRTQKIGKMQDSLNTARKKPKQ